MRGWASLLTIITRLRRGIATIVALLHHFLNHFAQLGNLLIVSPRGNKSYIPLTVDQERHGDRKHAVVKLVNMRVSHRKSVRQAMFLLEVAQIFQLLNRS